MRIRKDAWKLPAGDQTLVWYAKAIAVMQTRQISDPTSWRYQSAIHDFDATDPDNKPPAGQALPSVAEQKKYWFFCQHGTWFFLPWHRVYLLFFEKMLIDIIQKLGGPADWALPYWNYSDSTNPKARSLPPLFFAPTIPGGAPNPLLVAKRNRGANTGKLLGTVRSPDITVCLKDPDFSLGGLGGGTGFGGGPIGLHHPGQGGPAGDCEITPHGSMHNAVGGWMGAFNTAPLDPIFWLHHSNIDRLWEIWRKRDATHTDPAKASFLTQFPFDFHNETGAPVSISPSQVMDLTQPLCDYQYQDVSDPLKGSAHTAGARMAAIKLSLPQPRIPEMVGATEPRQPIVLGREPASIQVPIRPPTGPAARMLTADQRQYHLNIENVTATQLPVEAYAVYVNLPPNTDPEQHQDLLAGVMPGFGVVEASKQTQEHPGTGASYAFNITDVVNTLQAAHNWNPASVHVSFVPERGEAFDPTAVDTAPTQVGRVSLYIA